MYQKIRDGIIVFLLIIILASIIFSPGYQAQQDRNTRLQFVENQVDYLLDIAIINAYTQGTLQLILNREAMQIIIDRLTLVDSTATIESGGK